MTRVIAVLVVRLKADQDLSLKWCQRTGNMKPSRTTSASLSVRISVRALGSTAPSFGRESVVCKRKTNIQPINFSGPAVLELCWTKQPRSLCLPAPGAEAFGELLCCYRSSRIEMSPAALGPLIVFYFERDPLHIQRMLGEAPAPPAASSGWGGHPSRPLTWL